MIKCPYCCVTVELLPKNDWELQYPTYDEDDWNGPGCRVESGACPACQKIVITFIKGEFKFDGHQSVFYHIPDGEEIIYPKFSSRNVAPEVPETYRREYLESCSILNLSPKSSAALSRRILQRVLREELGINKRTLEKEIEEFISSKDVPSQLIQEIDAIRTIGNFAAHPSKDNNTGEIVEVEPGEAEWLVEVNEALFDWVFVQPKRAEERKNKLNAKLASIGKPPLKS